MKVAREHFKSPKDIPAEEFVTGGSPLCAGCGGLTTVRLVHKVLGGNVVLINAATVARHFGLGLAGDFELHPVQQRSHDPRTREARFEQGRFHVPARTASVFLRRD